MTSSGKEKRMEFGGCSPLRISFAGGGTDLPSYYERRRGAVLSTTISRYTRATVTIAPELDGQAELISVDLDRRATIPLGLHGAAGETNGLGLLAAAVARGPLTPALRRGFRLQVKGGAPPGSGLGGSSSVAAATLRALQLAAARETDRATLAESVYATERDDLGINCGRQDMYAVVYGGFNTIEFDRAGVHVTPLALPDAVRARLQERLILCYTGRTRRSSTLVGHQEQLVASGRADTLDAMAQLYDNVFAMREALLKDDLPAFAELLDASWQSKRRSNPQVSDADIDRLYDGARAAGADGGKLLGAGAGGFLLIYCEPHHRADVLARVNSLGATATRFAFEAEGTHPCR